MNAYRLVPDLHPDEPWRSAVTRIRPSWATSATVNGDYEVFFERHSERKGVYLSQFAAAVSGEDAIEINDPLVVLDDGMGGVIELSIDDARRLAENVLALVWSAESEEVIACSST